MRRPDRPPAGTCALHGLPLRPRRLRVRLGLPPPPHPGYDAARRAGFPHAAEPPGGGCLVGDAVPTHGEVAVCEACEAARLAWARAHPDA